VKKGQSVAIFGVGGVGLSAIAAAKVVEADPVIAVDLDEDKLEFAKKFGATHGVNASQGNPIEAIRDITRKHIGGGAEVFGADYVFDCIGVRQTMEQILPAARNGILGAQTGGTAVLVGVPMTEATLDARDLLINEKKYIGSIGGSCRPDRDFSMFLRWYAEGDLDLDALVTRRFKIDEINEAVHALEQGHIAGRAILEF
jgi:Zn-dependent alcohol dehydrogenase